MAVEAGARGELRARRRGTGLLGAVDGRDVAAREIGCAVDLAAWSPLWHSWQSYGSELSSRAGWTDPCGAWQLVQSSTTGVCSQRNGPRFSAWQVKQVSFTVFLTSSFGPVDP